MATLKPSGPRPRILRKPDVLARLQVSPTTLWRMQKSGSFPRPFRISPGLVGWLETVVSAWIEKRGRPPEA